MSNILEQSLKIYLLENCRRTQLFKNKLDEVSMFISEMSYEEVVQFVFNPEKKHINFKKLEEKVLSLFEQTNQIVNPTQEQPNVNADNNVIVTQTPQGPQLDVTPPGGPTQQQVPVTDPTQQQVPVTNPPQQPQVPVTNPMSTSQSDTMSQTMQPQVPGTDSMDLQASDPTEPQKPAFDPEKEKDLNEKFPMNINQKLDSERDQESDPSILNLDMEVMGKDNNNEKKINEQNNSIIKDNEPIEKDITIKEPQDITAIGTGSSLDSTSLTPSISDEDSNKSVPNTTGQSNSDNQISDYKKIPTIDEDETDELKLDKNNLSGLVGIYLYKKYLENNINKCSSLLGTSKDRCINRLKANGLRTAMKSLDEEKSKCKNDNCRQKYDQDINTLKQKLANLKENNSFELDSSSWEFISEQMKTPIDTDINPSRLAQSFTANTELEDLEEDLIDVENIEEGVVVLTITTWALLNAALSTFNERYGKCLKKCGGTKLKGILKQICRIECRIEYLEDSLNDMKKYKKAAKHDDKSITNINNKIKRVEKRLKKLLKKYKELKKNSKKGLHEQKNIIPINMTNKMALSIPLGKLINTVTATYIERGIKRCETTQDRMRCMDQLKIRAYQEAIKSVRRRSVECKDSNCKRSHDIAAKRLQEKINKVRDKMMGKISKDIKQMASQKGSTIKGNKVVSSSERSIYVK